MALARAFAQQGELTTATDTLTGVGFGTASAGRMVVAYVIPVGQSTTTAVSIGGITGNYDPNFSTGSEFGIITAYVPTGTSGNVVMTGSGGFQLLGAWAVTGGANLAPVAFSTDLSGTNAFNFNIPANGLVLGFGLDFATTATSPSFTSGLTNDGAVFTANGTAAARAGSAVSATAQTLTLSVSGAIFPGFLAASFSLLTINFRKTLSQIGGRVGARQSVRQ